MKMGLLRMSADNLSSAGYDALQAAIQLARNHQTKKLKSLRRLLLDEGFEESAITEAFSYWAHYEVSKKDSRT